MDSNSARLNELKDLTKDCQKCSLNKTRKQIVLWDGDGKARIMFVGIAPSIHGGDITGVPLTGKGGQFLRSELEKQGFKKSDIYFTNLIKCALPHNRDPYVSEIKQCQWILDSEIKLIMPSIIVPLGQIALYSFRPNEDIAKVHGKLSGIIFPMYHPSSIFRISHFRDIIINDIKKLKEIKWWE